MVSNKGVSSGSCDEDGKGLNSTLESNPISHYEILFNGIGVPTTEIHPGVLRCLTPGNLTKLTILISKICENIIKTPQGFELQSFRFIPRARFWNGPVTSCLLQKES